LSQTVKTRIVIAALTAAVALPVTSHASDAWEDAPPSVDAPRTLPPLPPPAWGATAVRFDLSGQLFGSTLTGVEVSYRFPYRVGLDVAVGESDMGNGHAGYAADLMGRLYLFNDSSGGVSLAGGPWIRTANEFGTVAFLSGEIAGEYRPRRGFSVLVGAGMSTTLNDSGQAHCPTNGLFDCWLWYDHYSKGEKTVNLRVAFGLSF
jgi:hypothetical protein